MQRNIYTLKTSKPVVFGEFFVIKSKGNKITMAKNANPANQRKNRFTVQSDFPQGL